MQIWECKIEINICDIDQKQKGEDEEEFVDEMFPKFVPKWPQKEPKSVIKMHEILNAQRPPKRKLIVCK